MCDNKEVYIRSVGRAIKILEAFNNKSKLGITEISKMLQIPKSTTHDIVTTLEKEGILEKDSESSKYYLGIKLFELGDRARENFELRKVAIPYLKELNEMFDETVHLTVPENGEVLYIECFESTKRLRTYSVIGIRAPMYCTAVGKAILAFLPDKEINKIIARSSEVLSFNFFSKIIKIKLIMIKATNSKLFLITNFFII